MRVASALGVSAEISALPAAALEVVGDWQVIVSPALARAAMVALPLLVPAVPVPVELLPLVVVALPPLEPPPPQPASASNNEESSTEWNFIDEVKKYEYSSDGVIAGASLRGLNIGV
jgi:predicted cobalt transporter CbtA